MAFLAGRLSGFDRSVVEDHLAACSSCADLLTWAAADDAHGSRSEGRSGRPFIGQLAPGSRVDRYQILGAVGRGGMGEVYAAYHPDLDRRIALKVVHEAGADSAVRRARLLREARATARLSHPNVVGVHDAGTIGDRVYIAMEFVEGETVDAWLRSKPRGWREILDVFIAAGRGLAAAHAAGIIHRDFKPQNVMIGRDGSVRVMDFGLARLAEEPPDAAEGEAAADTRFACPPTVTKTGALVGTLAYMSPEQFRGEKVDARADQFSFCAALHEAVYGNRPMLAHLVAASADLPSTPRAITAPAWLRAIVSRGLREHREQRFASMADLIGALAMGQARPRRRTIAASVTLAVVLVALGAWRVARGARVKCAVPTDRLAAIWSGHDDSRRRSIHEAFAATGRGSAETAWQRVSTALDEYTRQWSRMYVQACEATHVRGEQSGDVLDLRMSCLQDNLDQVRALTNVLGSADGATGGRAMSAVLDLPAISRCGDLSLLRSAVPLPRDQHTLEAVQSIRKSLREAQALRDLGNFRGARARAIALQSRAEATGYGPLLGEVLELIGSMALGLEPHDIEKTLHEALFTALAARDDATAARAASGLIDVVGQHLQRPEEAAMWFHLTVAILDRLGPGHERTRAWALNNYAGALMTKGDFESAAALARQAVSLKENALGKDHPDVAISLANLANALICQGRPAEALPFAVRALEIKIKSGDQDSDALILSYGTKGNALVELGRGVESEAAFQAQLSLVEQQSGKMDPIRSYPLEGLGEARLAQGRPASAIPFLEEALRIREATDRPRVLIAETRFYLARALWDSGGDRARALRLAAAAHQLASPTFPRLKKAIDDWLALHRRAKS